MSPTYAGSKAGLKMFAESLRARVRPHGIAVTLASPAFIDTPMSSQIKADKPFMISAETAAAIIVRKIEQRRREFMLPRSYALLTYLFRRLPRTAQRAIVARLPSY